jgi:hypothetical protein
MLSLRSILREADMDLARVVMVRAGSFETEVSQDDASVVILRTLTAPEVG